MTESADGSTYAFAHTNVVTSAGFTMIPNVVVLRRDLTPGAKLLYGYMKHLAWRANGSLAEPAKKTLCADFQLSDNTITALLKELSTAPAAEGDDDGSLRLIEVTKRGQGHTNSYRINDPVCLETRTSDSEVQEPQGLRVPARARSSRGKTDVSSETSTTTGARAAPPDVWLDGKQNLPLNKLCEVVGIDPSSPRVKEAITALNGRLNRAGTEIIEPGIRHLFWEECVRWAEEHDDASHLERAYVGPEAWARALVGRIEEKAQKYAVKYPGAAISPEALRRHWLDLELAKNGRRGGGMTPEEMERFVG